MHDRDADRELCRRALPRVSRTFAFNIRVLRGGMLESVRLAYLLCRAADALEDSWPGTPAEVCRRFDDFLAALHGDGERGAALAAAAAARASGQDDLALVGELPALLRVLEGLQGGDRECVASGVGTLVAGMKRYAVRAAERERDVPYLDDEAELHDYCYVVAGCVGEMLTRLFALRLAGAPDPGAARRLALAPVVGEALQLTNILLDWPSDVRRGRCHVPASWLAEHGLAPHDLAADTPAVRELARRLGGLANAALDRVPDYLETVAVRHVRYRLFCLLPALWARASLRAAGRDPAFPWGGSRPKLARTEVYGEALRGLLATASHGAVRRALAGGTVAPAPATTLT